MWEIYVGGYQETRIKNYASALIGASKSIENTNKRVNRSCCFEDKKLHFFWVAQSFNCRSKPLL